MKYSEERKSEKSIALISSILCEWDPIEVITDSLVPNDEYDNYIPAITMQWGKLIFQTGFVGGYLNS